MTPSKIEQFLKEQNEILAMVFVNQDYTGAQRVLQASGHDKLLKMVEIMHEALRAWDSYNEYTSGEAIEALQKCEDLLGD